MGLAAIQLYKKKRGFFEEEQRNKWKIIFVLEGIIIMFELVFKARLQS